MRTLLRELRGLIEYEASLHGPIVPLGTEEADEEPQHTAEDHPEATSASEPAAAEPVAAEPVAAEPATAEASEPSTAESSESPASPDLPAPSTTAEATPSDSPASADRSPTVSSNDDPSMPNRDLFGNEVDPAQDPSRPPSERIEALIPDDAPYKDLETLGELEEWVANHPLVPIDEDRQNPVFGVGDPNANLLIIGEAPGANEDKQGEPFVGRAGQLLDKILEAINFKREDVYIANILKSRPPNNRDPLAEEVEAHIPILYKQIALIDPAVILCVGKVAANTMLDRSSTLKSLRDKEHDFYGISLFATYHPAALLRNSNWKRPTWEDVQLVRTRYDELVS
jgi:uracil-DNA glycosylase